MARKARRLHWVIGVLTFLMGGSEIVRAASSQSEHFPVPAPTSAPIGINLKAIGFRPVGCQVNTLVAADAPAVIARKAASALCQCILEAGISCPGAVCNPVPISPLAVTCIGGLQGESFNLTQTAGSDGLEVGTGFGNIANLNCTNNNNYPDIRADLAARVLLQVRSNAIAGQVNVRIFHNQGGQNPRIASFNVGAADSSQTIANGIRDAINALAFSPDVIAVTHPPSDASVPLTHFPATYFGQYFVEITNAQAAGVTDVEVVVQSGQGFTLEPTENVNDIPTLSEWAMIILTIFLLGSGYWLLRRQRRSALA